MTIQGVTSNGDEFDVEVKNNEVSGPLVSGFKVLVISINGEEKFRLPLSAFSAMGLSVALSALNPLCK